ncbi:hypothetical protein [Thalassoglobus polymorphus]|uniref:Uncharacterized protein n=1 Tax=Thalassoglobus polymorphus TaxID=2527994 RepID=A0A517QNU9_9PLAN|nr:hypothetical protein [Thalassoglobus polymorphus]QDT33330.1 hypothetical protein Mal48_25830 [Thalassoglobus polymorphus]
MLNAQRCVNGQYRFDLSQLPAKRIETNRRFGLALCGFSLPFLIALLYSLIFLVQNEIWIIIPFPCFFLMIVGAIFTWGLLNLFTTIQTIISNHTVEEVTLRPWGEKRWEEPLSRFQLQVKVTTHRKSNSSSLSYAYHLRLRHTDDMKSIELHSTESPVEAEEQFRLYQQQLEVRVDRKVRNYNTDEVIDSPAAYGLDL